MCLHFPELGDECSWDAQTSFLQLLQCDVNSRPSFLEEHCSCLGYFFCTFFRRKNTRLVCLVPFSFHVAHRWVDGTSCFTDWESLVSGYSASCLAEALLQGTVLLKGEMLQLVYIVCFLSWGGSCWHCLLSGWLLILSTSAAGDAGWHRWSKFTSYVTSCTADASKV